MSGLAKAGRTTNEERLRIGVDANYPPYTYFDDHRRLSGLDPALAREACRRSGVIPEFVPIVWDRKDELLATGRLDCVWCCFTINGRENQYLWIPYLHSRQVVVVQQSSRIQTLFDLEGCTVALQSATRPESFFMEDPKAPHFEELISLSTTAEAFIAMHRGGT